MSPHWVVREREREGGSKKADESEMCYILWEEAKWKQCNLGDQYRAASREPAGWSENTKQEASSSFSLFLSLLSSRPDFIIEIWLPACIFKTCFGVQAKQKEKKQKKKWNMKVTLLALRYMPWHFSPAPQKQQGDPVNSLAEQIMWKCWQQQIWADWVI